MEWKEAVKWMNFNSWMQLARQWNGGNERGTNEWKRGGKPIISSNQSLFVKEIDGCNEWKREQTNQLLAADEMSAGLAGGSLRE